MDFDTSVLNTPFFNQLFIGTGAGLFIGGLYKIQLTSLTSQQRNEAMLAEMQGNQQLLREKENNMNSYIAEIERAREEDKKRQWTSEGLIKFTELVRHQENLQELADKLISQLVKYVQANQGGLFVVNEEEETPYLELLSCYAWNRKKHVQKKFIRGEGFIGQCWVEQDMLYITDVPDKFVNITSGLGAANPKSILIVPLTSNNQIYGVIELASFQGFEPYQQEFLLKIGEVIASFLATSRINEKTRLLLEQSQEQAEAMRSQEEEMRQNKEELQATQEEMRRTQMQLQEGERENQQKLVSLTEELQKREQEIEELKSQLDEYRAAI